MKLNFNPHKVAYIDFETQSECDLTKSTVKKYAQHSSTKALTCVVKVEDKVLKLGPYLTTEDKNILLRISEQYVLVAHNAPFDAAIWEDTLKLPEATWFDTLPCARAAGLPGGLDKLSKALGGRGKHKDGERLIQMLCCIKNGRIPAIGPAHQLLMEYNVQDVEELEIVYNRVKDYGEPEVMEVDRIINDRGIPVNEQLLFALRDMFEQNSKKFGDEFAEFTKDPDRLEGLNPRSPKQLHIWLQTRGVNITDKDGKQSLGKPIVQQFLANPEEYVVDGNGEELAAVKEMLELRRELAGVGRGKVDKALELIDGGRIYDQFIYFGAHTGRWSSRGLQLHNMPSALKVSVDMRHIEPTYEAVSTVAKEVSERTKTHVTVSDCLNIMLRRIVEVDNLLVVDYGAVEARCLAWLANAPTMMAAYNDPKESLYLRMGDVVFQRRIDKKQEQLEYVLCKALVLGCGYGMSGAKFKAQCAIRESREFMKMLEDTNIDLAECVKTYRKTYPEVPKLWSAMGEAALTALRDGSTNAGKCEFRMVGTDLRMVLPSKRPVIYRNARVEMVVPAYCKMYGMPETAIPTVTFDNPRGFRGFLYGAKITENACQAICRDLIAEALVHLEQDGLPVILHVHDEIACAGPDNKLERMCEIMTCPASWADGFPVLVEGYSGKQWTKTYDGYRDIKMLRGKVV